MRLSRSFFPTLKEDPKEAQSPAHKITLKAALIKMLLGGVYSYLPLGFFLLKNIERVIREEMLKCGAQEVLLPALQPVQLWIDSGRDSVIGDIMFRFQDRRGRNLCLGPTHEEVITDLVKGFINSYKQLPIVLFQIQTKFRDEIRPRFGLVRSCEFIMKDAYSFDSNWEGLDKNYKAMFEAYRRIFKRCGLDSLSLQADTGIMGGAESSEFMVLSDSGEDKVNFCKTCNKYFPFSEGDNKCVECGRKSEVKAVLELGHIFKLGTKYSEKLGLYFLDEEGKRLPVIMGCYGIGVSRMVVAVVEKHMEKKGVIFPLEVAPFEVILVSLDSSNSEIVSCAERVYEKLEKKVRILFDDRNKLPAGVKLNDASLIGSPFFIIVGKRFLSEGKIEIEVRREKKKIMVREEEILSVLTKLIKNERKEC